MAVAEHSAPAGHYRCRRCGNTVPQRWSVRTIISRGSADRQGGIPQGRYHDWPMCDRKASHDSGQSTYMDYKGKILHSPPAMDLSIPGAAEDGTDSL